MELNKWCIITSQSCQKVINKLLHAIYKLLFYKNFSFFSKTFSIQSKSFNPIHNFQFFVNWILHNTIPRSRCWWNDIDQETSINSKRNKQNDCPRFVFKKEETIDDWSYIRSLEKIINLDKHLFPFREYNLEHRLTISHSFPIILFTDSFYLVSLHKNV